jgi:paraquat-inducible protein B
LPFPVVWLVPVFAVIAAAYYLRGHIRERGPEITVGFVDGSGLRAGETPVTHRGVQIGTVSAVGLSEDQKRVLVGVRLTRRNEAFAREGASFWVVRPQIGLENVSGLGTVVSGPYIEAVPGGGDAGVVTEFAGLEKAPVMYGEGLHVELRTPQVDRLQVGSPVYYRGIQVGSVREIRLSPNATHVTAQLFIRQRYAPLVRTTSRFWTVATADVSGGIFRGLEVRLGTLRNLISGGVTFATPEGGDAVPPSGGSFALHAEPEKDWLKWAPEIRLAPELEGDGEAGGAVRK